MNTEMAYLLGMITGNGTLQRGFRETTVSIDIPHKKMLTEQGQNVSLMVKASITDIRQILEPLLGHTLRFEQAKKSSIISFTCPNEGYIMREILNFMNNQVSHETMRIPEDVFNTFSIDQKKSFLQGFGDVTAYIRSSNAWFGKEGAHRVYVEIPHNWYLVIDYCNLLKQIHIPVQSIDWAHPNMRDPKVDKFNNGNESFWKKEHQVKIWSVIYESIGFNVIHKQECLQIFAQEQRDSYREDPEGLQSLYRFYWQTQSRGKIKSPHPGEFDDFIPIEIWGKHYNSWREIAYDLGYRE